VVFGKLSINGIAAPRNIEVILPIKSGPVDPIETVLKRIV
jgi:hypothetical protein